MSEDAASTRHISMKGGGYYSKATTGAKDVIDGGTPLILEALASMDIPDEARPFTMADSGCADGGARRGKHGPRCPGCVYSPGLHLN